MGKYLQKKDLMKARKLYNVFRFLDDLNAINDVGIFENNFRDIYSQKLELFLQLRKSISEVHGFTRTKNM